MSLENKNDNLQDFSVDFLKPVLLVTKGNSDESIHVGDHIWFSVDGDLHIMEKSGWLAASELDAGVMDFSAKEDKEHVVHVSANGERVISLGFSEVLNESLAGCCDGCCG